MIVELLAKRGSVRKFQKRGVAEGLVREILEAGRLSPSGGNEQAWAFGVVTDPALIAEIAVIADNQAWIAQAPLLIVLCTVPVGDDRGGRDTQILRYPRHAAVIEAMDLDLFWALNQEEHQTKIAGTHMALAALEHGVGSCWVSHFDVGCLAELLHLPETYLPSEILVMGYPEQAPRMQEKKPLAEIVFRDRYH